MKPNYQVICVTKMQDVTYVARVHNCANALAQDEKNKVSVISLKPRVQSFVAKEESKYQEVKLNLYTRRFQFPLVPFFRFFEAQLRFLVMFLKIKADVYVVHDLHSWFVAYIASLCYRTKIIYNSDELESDRNPNSKLPFRQFRKFYSKLMDRLASCNSDCIIQADRSRALWVSFAYNINSVYFLRNLPEIVKVEKDHCIHNRLGLKDGYKIILYQGQIGEGRGIENSVKAFAKANVTDAILVLLGMVTTSYQESIESLAEKHCVGGSVKFLPPVKRPDLLRWTVNADVTLSLIEKTSLSFYYSAPNKLYESMMVGVPFIASNHPEIKNVNNRCIAGLLVQPENIDEIAGAMRYLLTNDGARATFSMNGINSALGEYNWNAESLRYNAMFRHMLAR